MIKGRENKAQSTDFLVCFPTRAHLSLMPKPVCSPNRPSEPNKRHNHHLKRINTRASGAGTGGPNSPLMWAKNNQMRQEVSSEPTSPKVTCAGQIKVRPSSSTACKSWQSVMEEIERIHNRGKDKKKPKWAETFGFKKDVTNFLTCLRNVRFDFRCFGAFPQADIVTSDDDEDEEEEFEDDEFDICEENQLGNNNNNNNTTISDDNSNNNNNAVFSKWFMVLQENNNDHVNNDLKLVHEDVIREDNNKGEDEDDAPAVPPPNALLLMRCRSAPAKSWLEEKEIDDKEQKSLAEEKVVKREEEEKKDKKKRESLAILMKYDTDFYNLSSEIAQETWVVGGLKDAFSRSRSWRR